MGSEPDNRRDDSSKDRPGNDDPGDLGDTGTGREGRTERNYLDPPRGRLTRRRALGVIGAGGAVGAGLLAGRRAFFTETASRRDPPAHPRTTTTAAPTTETPTTPPTTEPPAPALWSDPATWDGAIPGQGDVAVVDRPVLLDVDTQVAGVQIEAAGQLIYDPAVSHTLTSSGNVVVHGALRMRPDDASIHHVLSFVGVDEASFVGGHVEEPPASDVGLWVLHAGVLDLFGTPKTAWTNLAGEAAAGDSTITVDDATAWLVGDEIVVTPTEAPTDEHHWRHHDRRVVTAVAGNQVSLDQPLEHPHPAVTVRDGVTHRAEVLNLGRNVRIEGAPEAKAHVIVLHGQVPHQLGWVGLRHLGPNGVLGRYALHFHMCDDGTRGSTLDGLVVADSGNHAFVVHLSNGVALQDCVVHDNVDEAYWWDLGTQEAPGSIPSHDVVYEHCVASYVKTGVDPHTCSGFLMGAGQNNVARNCVAVGVEGTAKSSAGFRWSPHSRDENLWAFEDNLSHNNRYSGLYYWQNNVGRTIVDRFTVYHSRMGVFAGSYTNRVSYRDNILYACNEAGLIVSATPGDGSANNPADETITYEGMYVDQAGLTEFAVEITKHVLSHDRPTVVSDGTFRGGTKAQVAFPEGGENNQVYEFVNCSFDGNAFWIAEGVPADAQIHVVDATNGSIMLHPPGGPGERIGDWNATVTPA